MNELRRENDPYSQEYYLYSDYERDSENEFYTDQFEDEDEAYDRRLAELSNPNLMTKTQLCQLMENKPEGSTLDLSTKFFAYGILPGVVFEMKTVEVLDLQCNDIENIPDEIEHLKSLRILNLSHNRIKNLPSTLHRCTSLEELIVQSNRLTTLPNITLANLKIFDCENNQLGSIAIFLKNTRVLQRLNLSNNPLYSIPSIGENLSSLIELNCRGIGLLETPKSLTQYKSVEKLDLSKNTLKKIDHLPPNIRELYFFGCCKTPDQELESFQALGKCKKLKNIAGWDNRMKTIPAEIFQLNAVTKCNLANNRLEVLPPQIGQMKSLESLVLDGNHLTFLPEDLCELKGLKLLQIARNKIKELPLNFYKLESLTVFAFERNPWKRPPIEVLKRGIEDVKEYFLELRSTRSIEVLEQKVILLGDSEAGKTSLTNALKDGESKLTTPEERTVVLELHKWEPEIGITYQLNDFGGHDIYQVTHPFFLNKNAIHLLLFDTVQFIANDIQDVFERKIVPWLLTLQDIVPGAVLRLVGTHIDKLERSDVQEIRTKVTAMTRSWTLEQIEKTEEQLKKIEDLLLQDPSQRKKKNNPLAALNDSQLKERRKVLSKLKYLQLKWDLKVHMVSSAQEMKGVESLKEEIIATSKDPWNFPFAFRILPDSWFHLVDHISAVSEFDILSIEHVREMAAKHFNLNKNGLETALRYLHDVGRILWYSDQKNVETIVFHKVIVLVELLKALFRHDAATFLDVRNPLFKGISRNAFKAMKDNFLNFGNVAFELLECLWGQFNLGKDTIPKLCELLEKFNLCYRFEEDNPASWASSFIHVPWLLDENAPINKTNIWPKQVEKGKIQLQIEYDFDGQIPNGFYEKSSVALHNFTTDHISEWKHGVVAKVNMDKIHLKRDNCMNTIQLITRSSDISSAWKTIYPVYRKLRLLLEEWPGKQSDIYEICPHCLIEGYENPAKFPYEMLETPPPKGLEVKCCPIDDVEMEIEYVFVHPDAANTNDSKTVTEEQPSIWKRFRIKTFFITKKRQVIKITEDDSPKYRVSSKKGYFSQLFRLNTEPKSSENFTLYVPRIYAISDSQLSQLARNLPDPAWRQFAIEILQIPHSYITQVEAERHPDMWMVIFKVLKYWREREDSEATVETLTQLLHSAPENDICIDVDCCRFLAQ